MDAEHVRQPTKVGRIDEKTYAASVETIEQLTPTTLSIQANATEPVDYLPGQYCMVATGTTARAYSFINLPGTPNIEFLISTSPGGPASRFWSATHPGATFTFTAPYGNFLVDATNRPLVYIAGGTGLAPIYAHLLELGRQKTARPITLMVGHRTADDVFWRDKLTTLAAQYNFIYQLVTGSLTPALRELTLLPNNLIYICGSAGMCTSTAETLYQKGTLPQNVHYELYT